MSHTLIIMTYYQGNPMNHAKPEIHVPKSQLFEGFC